MSAQISLADAIAVTGATTGKAITEGQLNIPRISDAATTKLVAFVQQLKTDGNPVGTPNYLWSLSVARTPGDVTKLQCSLIGTLVFADSSTAAKQLTSIPNVTQEFIGEVP
jgi:hypothetical protein